MRRTWYSPAARAFIAPRRTGTPTCIAFPAAWTRNISPRPRNGMSEARATRRRCPSAPGIFRGDRRALDLALLAPSPPPTRSGRSSWSGPVVKIDPATLPRPAEHPLLRPAAYEQLPAYPEGLGRVPAAVCAQRLHPIHQPHQDAGIHGGGKMIVSTPITTSPSHTATSSTWAERPRNSSRLASARWPARGTEREAPHREDAARS